MKNRRAFTLLELLLTTALTAMLMAGVAAVVAQLGRSAAVEGLGSGEEAAGARVLAADVDAWAAMLRDDLGSAREVRKCATNELAVVSYSVLDAQRRELTHRPALIEYGIVELDGRRWVVRRQAAMDLLTNQNVQRDLVCGGVTRFEILRHAATHLQGAASPPGHEVWRLRVWTDEGEHPAHDLIVTVGGRMGT